ncbi:MAG TPA: hypothetical protein VEV84_07955 [Pyrinomonadaceae bacterium]|nr:hypothetical protein [Pyrinomonadaceae bacterium]
MLELAYRMSLGDRPYVDFPFPYAPLTFLIQARVIRLWGTVYWHHIAYVAIVGGLATVLTWRVLVNILRDSLSWPRLTAFLLTLPIIILGIYCIFPHPFYDPDAMLFILLSTAFILWLERHGFPLILTFLAGMLLVVPLFVKQNIGLAFLGSLLLALVVLVIGSLWKKLPLRGYLALIAGAVVGLVVAALIVQWWVGLETYKYWTWDFARLRRTPSAQDMWSVYQDPLLVVWLASFAVGVVLFWINKNTKRVVSAIATLLLTAPFFWPDVYLLIDQDASERGERLANVWPVVLLTSLVLSVLSMRRVLGVRKLLPFVLVVTAHGVFLSQQLWGSTYGIWPILVLLVGLIVLSLNELTYRQFSRYLTAFAAIASMCLIAAGAFYVYSNDRLDYVDFEDGDVQQSNLPQLEGMSVRGDYLPDFEELVHYTNENIPADDGILELPGEDLFYYTTGRRPQFPVLLFDVTNNPYTPEQIADMARERGIKWLIVKNDLQIDTDKSSGDKTIDDKDAIFEAMHSEFKHIESLNNYEIYRRKLPGETDDEDDNDSGDDSDDDSGN